MKTYSPDFLCPKCGNDHATTQYTSGANRDLLYFIANDALPPDLIVRRCSRCAYYEFQKPLDAPPDDDGTRHINSYDPDAVCLCGEQVVEIRPAGRLFPALYQCPKAPVSKARDEKKAE